MDIQSLRRMIPELLARLGEDPAFRVLPTKKATSPFPITPKSFSATL
jgi:hypothetical protein